MKSINPTNKGLITGVLMILASIFSLFVLKNPVDSYFQLIIYAIFSVGIVWSLLSYSNQVTEKASFKEYFSIGFKTFIVVTLLMAVFAFFYFTSHPEFRDNKIAENNRLLILQGDHLPNEISENSKQLKKMFMPMMISAAVFRYLIIGVLITVITAGFLSKKNVDSATTDVII